MKNKICQFNENVFSFHREEKAIENIDDQVSITIILKPQFIFLSNNIQE